MRYLLPAFLCATLLQASCGNSDASPSPTVSSQPSGTGSTTPAPTASSTPTALPASTSLANQARYVGRFNFASTPGKATFAWPNTAIGVNFSGTGLSVQLGDLSAMEVDSITTHNMFDVSVDGNATSPITMAVGVSTYVVASNLPAGNHTVWITKRTEAIVGTAVLGGFSVTGGTLLTPPAARAHRIEVYGDSNETGYGDLATVTDANMCSFTYQTEDADIAYPQLVATQLNADLTTMAYAGIGIFQNAFPTSDPNPMPSIYDLIDPNDPNDPNGVFDFSGTTEPDIVIIDLGGNDFYSDTPAESDFVNAYTTFLQTLRGHYPNTPIVSVMGPTMIGTERTDIQAWVQAAIAQRQSAGDNNISFVPFAEYDGSTYGCDYHPDAAMHQSMATAIQPSVSSAFAANAGNSNAN